MATSKTIPPIRVNPTLKTSDQRKRVSVLIAADSPMDCQLLSNTLEHSRSPLCVVGKALTTTETLRLTEAHSPDVALINESLQDGPTAGLEVLRSLRFRLTTKTILLLRSAREEQVVAAFRSGVSGVFCRHDSVGRLSKCIVAVHGGQIWADSRQLRCVLDAFIDTPPRTLPNPVVRAILTRREMEVATLVLEGHTNRSVAERLGLAEHTVSNYLFRMYEKLGVSNRVELVLYLLDASQKTVGKTLSLADTRSSVRKRLAVAE